MYSGVSTASLFLREMNEDSLSILDGLGVRSTEVFLTTLSEYTEEFANLLNKRKGKLKVNSVHLLNTQFEPQLFGAHPRAKADAFRILDGAMRSAHIFGAERYTFHGITRLKKKFCAARSRQAWGTALRDFSCMCGAFCAALPGKRALGDVQRAGIVQTAQSALSRSFGSFRRETGAPFRISVCYVY